jgi:uncharacterized protein (TIGR03437 family)
VEDPSGSPILIGNTASWDIYTTPGGPPSPFKRPNSLNPPPPSGGFILRANAALTKPQFAGVFTKQALSAASEQLSSLFGYAVATAISYPDTRATVGILDLQNNIQSAIAAGGDTEAVSNQPNAITPGGIARLTGMNLASGDQTVPPGPLPTQLSGTQVMLDGAAGPLMQVSPTQIEFQVPWDTSPAVHTVRVSQPHGTTGETPVWVVPSYPVMFSDSATNDAMAFNSDGSPNTYSNPALPGSTVRVLFSGVGNVSPAPGPGQPAPPSATATATVTSAVGPFAATVQWAGASPGLVGISEAWIKIPSAPAGIYSLWITAGDVRSNRALIAIGAGQ